MDGRKFPSLNALAQAISTRPSDIDKLFCIFYYVIHNIEVGEGDCGAFFRLFCGVAMRCGLTGSEATVYYCFAKVPNWDDPHPPDAPTVNHAAVLVILNGAKFICELSWDPALWPVTARSSIFIIDLTL
jgi:hypothetical protein